MAAIGNIFYLAIDYKTQEMALWVKRFSWRLVMFHV